MKKILVIAATLAMAASIVVYNLAGTASANNSGKTIRGVVGGDFDSQLPPGSINGADWGVDVTLTPNATNLIHDGNVFVVVSGWVDGGGQTQPTTSDGGPCTGTVSHPTAPSGDVCVYVAGGDNASDVSGVSVIPGTGGSKMGFKLLWDSSAHNGDTFIDAVWAYKFP